MFHGMCLFVLGLLTGFAEQHFANVRMGLAAHLEGLMNGTFLVALGAIWTHVRLSPGTKTIAFWTGLYGAYVNWLINLLAAVLGTGALIANHRGWPHRSALAGELSHGWLHECRRHDCRFLCPRSSGSSRQSIGAIICASS